MTTSSNPIVTSEAASEAQPRRRVVTNIRDAAESTGVPFEFLLAQATQESRLNPEARNHRSTAAGLFQFTAPTWLDMIKKHGAEHGLAAEADAIVRDRSGRLSVPDKAMRKAILDLRRDPKLSSLMAGELAKENAKVLEDRLGRPASAPDLYLAHFLGASGAARVIERMEDDPRHAASGLLPEAARANPEVFHEPGSHRPRSVAALYKAVQNRIGAAAGAGHPAPYQSALARLHPTARPEAEAPLVQVASAPPPAPPVPPPVPSEAKPAAPAGSFATAVQPASPFFPIPLPPAADQSVASRTDDRA
ncbi:MAG: transglycosylase SLT domain-containing protein [Actinomycetota bacterium]